MNNFSWFSRLKHRGDDITDVISGEFFPDNDRPALPLIREALQNAIDAGKNIDRNGHPIHVRIALCKGKSALSPTVTNKWFGGLQDHIRLEGNGLRQAPNPDEPCDYMVVEDFGTCGLTGDIQDDSVEGIANNFVDFLRSDGRTRKASGAQGSWGVGKNVFPRSSRINSYIAYTIRHDDQLQLVMGKCILKIRAIGENQFQPPSYLAASWDPDDVPSPVNDPTSIEQLIKDFGLKRRGEPGLSLVIPWIYESMRSSDLLEAVVSEYYYAILSGTLRITIEIDGEIVELTSESLREVAGNREGLVQYTKDIDLACWAQQVQDADRIVLASSPPPDLPQKWIPSLLTDEEREIIKDLLLSQERIAIRVPIHIVKSKVNGGSDPVPTYLDIYLEQENASRSEFKPLFFREQLCINDVKRAAGAQKIRSLVVIDDEPLATMLRAAEPPNHSDWAAGTSNFKGLYIHGNHVVTFVKTAVRSLVSFVRASEDTPDASIAIDYFARPAAEGVVPPKPARKKKKPGQDPVDPPPPPPPPKRKRFSLSMVDSGFRIGPGDEGAEPPKSIVVSMAYDVFSGSPWKLYETADFDLTKKGLTLACSGGASVNATDSNKLKIEIESRPFEVFVTGFDTNRDLIVNARPIREVADVDSTNELHEED